MSVETIRLSGYEITISDHSSLFLNGRITNLEKSMSLIKSLINPVTKSVKSKKEYEIPSNAQLWSSSMGQDGGFGTTVWFKESSGYFNQNWNNNDNYVRPCVALDSKEITNWVLAYENCCIQKKGSAAYSKYRFIYEKDLLQLIREIKTRVYFPGVSTCFIVTDPKPREIFAANFRDRIVQHWITLRLNPILEERFISQGNVSFNCRKGFGILAAVKRLEQNILDVSENYTTDAYIGKFDMKSFFMSIDKERLLFYLIPFIRKKYKGDDIEDLIWLLEVIIRHEPQTNCIKKGDLRLWNKIPPEKSLFNAPTGKGLPIGNYLSQLLANFYLSFFDDFMLGLCKGYGAKYIRFVDDFVVVAKDKFDIKELRRYAEWFLQERLFITLHPDKVYIQDVKKGVKFIGSVIKPGRTYLSNRSVYGFYSVLDSLDNLCCEIYLGIKSGSECRRLLKDLEHYICSVNSYLGLLIHTASYNIRCKALNRLTWFWGICNVDQKSRVVRIKPEYKLINYEKNRK